MVTVDVDISNLIGKFAQAPSEIKKETLNLTAQDLIGCLMRNSPVDHGLLKQWAVTSQSDDEVVIQSPAEYAPYVNYGTKEHWIEPVNAKALHWDGNFSKGHMVSGIEGKHFVEDSIEEVKSRIESHFTIACSKVTQ